MKNLEYDFEISVQTHIYPKVGVFPISKDGKKTCSHCGTKYPAITMFFYQNSNRRDGLDSWCKKCKRLYDTKRHRREAYGITDEIFNMIEETRRIGVPFVKNSLHLRL